MCALIRRVSIGAAMGLFALASQANAGGVVAPSPYVTTAPGYETTFHPVCLTGTHYACRIEAFGTRFCGCWIGGDRPACPIGYTFACGPAPDGARACGCY
jgi:hypothetical protein